MKTCIVIAGMILMLSFAYSQGWNNPVTTSINASTAEKMDNFSNRNGVHLLTVGGTSDNQTVRYQLLNSSGTVIRTTTFESGANHPCISGDDERLYVFYWKNQAIRTWKSVNAGVTWSDAAVEEITPNFGVECNGIDAVKDGRGVHIVYGLNNNEVYYQKSAIQDNQNWTDFKNVTDYTEEENGTMPSIATSSNRVHVGYRMYYNVYASKIKTRDFNYSTLNWEAPLDVHSDKRCQTNKLISVGNTLHIVFSYVGFDMAYYSTYFHCKRNVESTYWGSAELLFQAGMDVLHDLNLTYTLDGNVHTILPCMNYRVYNGSSWSTNQIINGYNYEVGSTLTSSGNDLFYIFNSGSIIVQQLDAIPTSVQNPATQVYFDPNLEENYAKVTWALNPECDVFANAGGYQVWRRIHNGISWGSYSQIATVNGTQNYYVDLQVNGAGHGPKTAEYKICAVDVNNHIGTYSTPVQIKFGSLQKQGKEQKVGIPTEYSLDQNYPNPFNPETNISFGLPEQSMVKVVVYDMLGREISQLFEGTKSAGIHTIRWNGSAREVSGIYLCRLTVTGVSGKQYTSAIKMSLMK